VVPNDAGKSGAVVWFPNWLVTDNIMPIPYLNVSQPYLGLVNGSVFPLGINMMKFVWVDPSQIPSICAFNITVTDDNACTKGNGNGGCSSHALCKDKAAPAAGTPDALGRDCYCKPGFFGDGISCIEYVPDGSLRLNLTLNQSITTVSVPTLLSTLTNVSHAQVGQINIADLNAIDSTSTLVFITISADPTKTGPTPNDIVSSIKTAVDNHDAALATATGYSVEKTTLDAQTGGGSDMSDLDKMGLILGLVALGGLLIVGAYWLAMRGRKPTDA
jgi:hypothetical protein